MKVKLLEPVDGFEEIAEWRVPKEGEYYYGPFGKPMLSTGQGAPHSGTWPVLTPKPLPVVEWPKWLGCVRNKDSRDHVKIVVGIHKGYLDMITPDGNCVIWPKYDVKNIYELHRTANIPTSPELEALFKE